MNIYIAIWNDRHTSTTAHPFTDKKKAIEWAKSTAKDGAKELVDYQEHYYGIDQGWVFYAEYSCEGDCIYVVETELDQCKAREKLNNSNNAN